MDLRLVWLVDLGRMPYQEAWTLQRTTAEAVLRRGLNEVVYLVEHPAVYTIGRAAHGQSSNLLWDEAKLTKEGIQLFEVDRGGDITYHGPGQVVAYPILNLDRPGDRDLHRYLRDLEEAIILTLADWNLAAGRFPPNTGVWIGGEKIAAIGVKASHWVTQHGLALNVHPNMDHFSGIIPCGIRDHGVTSIEQQLGHSPPLADVKAQLSCHLSEVFQIRLESLSLADLRAFLQP